MIELCSVDKCTYCKACISACNHEAISFIENEYGFSYPKIDVEKCIECNKCVKSCPILTPIIAKNDYPECFAIYSKKKNVVQNSTSGGIFFELAKAVIENGGCVFGVVNENKQFLHKYAECIEGLYPMRGSKYVQSEMGNSYIEAKKKLDNKQIVLFSGTSCQIAGLRSFLRKEYNNLLTCEVICHGVPSYRILERTMSLSNLGKEDWSKTTFRDNKRWNYDTIAFDKENNKHYLFWKGNIYMKLFMKKYIFKDICYSCPFAQLPRIADFTIGDFWGIRNTKTFKVNTSGTSVMLLNTSIANNFFDDIADRFNYEKRSVQEAADFNKNIICPTQKPVDRDDVLRDLFKMDNKNKFVSKYHLKLTARNILGYLYRKLR